MSAFYTSPTTYSSAVGEFVSQAHVHLARVLKDYNHYLSLVYVPKKDRDATDTRPYGILNSTPGAPEHIIRHISEEEMKNPQEILEWVFEGDLNKHRPNDVYNKIMAKETAAEAMKILAEEEEALDRQEKMAFLVSGGRDKKNFVRHNGKTFQTS